MTNQEATNIKEIEDKLNTPIAQLAEHCNDPEFLASLLSFAFNLGIQIGQHRIALAYNEMFQGYDSRSLHN